MATNSSILAWKIPQRNPVSYSWSYHRELDTTEWLSIAQWVPLWLFVLFWLHLGISASSDPTALLGVALCSQFLIRAPLAGTAVSQILLLIANHAAEIMGRCRWLRSNINLSLSLLGFLCHFILMQMETCLWFMDQTKKKKRKSHTHFKLPRKDYNNVA